MKEKYVYTERQLIGKGLKLNAKNHIAIKSLQEALTKRTNNNWYGRKEAANYLGISTRTLDRYRADRDIKAYQSKVNGYVRYRKTDLDKFLKIK